jgi:tungstate transport system permease protein
MNELCAAVWAAGQMIAHLDRPLLNIVELSLRVSLTAVGIASVIGFPVGAAVALFRFPGRAVFVFALNTLLGLPPVAVGLIVCFLLSRSGPLGSFGLLFTPAAMILPQAVLVTPIVAALARQVIEDLWQELREQLQSLGVNRLRAIPTLLWEARSQLLTVVLAGFGRAISEVGAIIIVGGNIIGATRTMTTAIALETVRGNLPIALALGFVLMSMAVLVNATAYAVGSMSRGAAAP